MKIVKYDRKWEAKWNDYLDGNSDATVFHTLEWKDIIAKTYGFEPHYLLAVDDAGKVQGAACSFLTRSLVFGRKLISTPFNFYNDLLFSSPSAGELLLRGLVSIGKRNRAKFLQIKALHEIDKGIEKKLGLIKDAHYFISIMDVFEDVGRTVSQYHKRVTKNLRTLKRNAEKNDIRIVFGRTEKELKEFYDVLVRIYRDKHQMIPQPYALYSNMRKMLGKRFRLLLAKKDGEVIGGMILLLFKDRVVYAYGASKERYRNLSPSNLLVDFAIRWSSENSFGSFDFGVTSPYQEGLYIFKDNWGAKRSRMPFYYALIEAKEVHTLDYHTAYASFRKFFKYVPICLIKTFSPFITKQLG